MRARLFLGNKHVAPTGVRHVQHLGESEYSASASTTSDLSISKTVTEGNFITVALNFFILAFVIFMMVKQVNRMKREVPAPGGARGGGPRGVSAR